jgi:hypothetical protein
LFHLFDELCHCWNSRSKQYQVDTATMWRQVPKSFDALVVSRGVAFLLGNATALG